MGVALGLGWIAVTASIRCCDEDLTRHLAGIGAVPWGRGDVPRSIRYEKMGHLISDDPSFGG
jgi:hypothetical protein